MTAFRIPFFDYIRSFRAEGLLLLLIPLVIGFFVGLECRRKTSFIWAIISGALTVIVTILYQFERQYHLFGWIGYLVSPYVTAFFIGVLIGRLWLRIRYKE